MEYEVDLCSNLSCEEKNEQTVYALLKTECFPKCSRCKNALSVAPILVVDDLDIYCGRCKHAVYQKNSRPKIERQVIYEFMANWSQHTWFPCRFKNVGCESSMQWKEAAKHEDNCTFRIINCPLDLNNLPGTNICNWRGDFRDYFIHLGEEHEEHLSVVDKWEIWDEPPRTRVNRIIFLEYILLVIITYIDNKPYLVVIGDDKKHPVEFNVEITDETDKITITYTHLSTFLPWNYVEMKKFGIDLNITDIRAKYLSIYFGEKRQCTGKCDAVKFPQCDCCDGAITLPVKTCKHGHINCKKCATGQELCKFWATESLTIDPCGERLRENKNLHINFLRGHFACLNKGCFFHGNISELTFHARSCKCKIFRSPDISELDTFYPISRLIILKFDHLIFTIRSSESEDCLQFTLQTSRMPADKYEFEITIENSSSFVLTFPIFPNFSNVIPPLPVETDNSIGIPLDFIDLDRKGGLRYRINVSRI